MADIEAMLVRGHTAEGIVRKTGLSPQYVHSIIFLLKRGEERLIEGVQKGQIPLTTALEIVKASDNNKEFGDVLQQAYEAGHLRGRQLSEARRLLERRSTFGPAVSQANAKLPVQEFSAGSLVRTYQREVARKKKMLIKAEYSQSKLLLLIEALRNLFLDENFVTLLRAEGLETLPTPIAERVRLNGGC